MATGGDGGDAMEVALYGPLCRAVDLGYALNADTIMWPGGEGFCLCMTSSGSSPAPGSSAEADGAANTYYAAGTFSCAEHGGTHVDAPRHFFQHGCTVDQLELGQLVGCARVLQTEQEDVRVEHILAHEAAHGALPRGCIVLCRTGWAAHYARGPKAYLGFDEKLDGPYDAATTQLSFPGVTREAAELLVRRAVAAVGLDTASLDPGANRAFDTHRVLLSAGIFGIENLSGELAKLPPKGATVMIMPMKISGGSGAPARVVAFLPPPGIRGA